MELTLHAEVHSLDSQIPGTFISALSRDQTISHFPTDNRPGDTFCLAQPYQHTMLRQMALISTG